MFPATYLSSQFLNAGHGLTLPSGDIKQRDFPASQAVFVLHGSIKKRKSTGRPIRIVGEPQLLVISSIPCHRPFLTAVLSSGKSVTLLNIIINTGSLYLNGTLFGPALKRRKQSTIVSRINVKTTARLFERSRKIAVSTSKNPRLGGITLYTETLESHDGVP